MSTKYHCSTELTVTGVYRQSVQRVRIITGFSKINPDGSMIADCVELDYDQAQHTASAIQRWLADYDRDMEEKSNNGN